MRLINNINRLIQLYFIFISADGNAIGGKIRATQLFTNNKSTDILRTEFTTVRDGRQ